MRNLPVISFGAPQLTGAQFCQTEDLAPAPQVDPAICLSYDWIEFTGTMPSGEVPAMPFQFRVEEQEKGTPYYTKLYKVYTTVHGEEFEFCNLQTKPRPSFLDVNLVQVKLANRFCYSPDLATQIERFCREFGIAFKHYTRLDYAIDFQQVAIYGFDIQGLMQRFAARELVLKGRGMVVHSDRSQIGTIRWGSRASGQTVSMYNKSLEMRKKSSKPWITELWEQASFDPAIDTYRLEICTKAPRYDMVDEDAVMLGSFDDVRFLDLFNEHLCFLYHTFFQVAVAQRGVRFSRLERYEPFPLFIDAVPHRRSTHCVKQQSNNIKKTVIKNIVLEAAFLQRDGNRLEASYAWDLAMHYVERYGLQRWFARVFDRLNIKTTHLSHYDIIHSADIKIYKLKQGSFFSEN